MLLLENSIYESRLGYPVYYHGNGHGYLPPTPPYSHSNWESPSKSSPVELEFTKSEGGFSTPDQSMVYQPLVYPQFPTPPLSVSPGPLRTNSPSPAISNAGHQRTGDSFQIKRILNLDHPLGGQEYVVNHEEQEQRLLAMRTASVIMKIEDQRVFQVDSTTAALTDDDSSFDHQLHLRQQQQQSEMGSPPPVLLASSPETLFICKWEKCYKVFRHLNDLASHVTQAHGTTPVGSVNYYCKWEGCPRTDRGFNARYKMLVHIRTHTKEKPHQCPDCHKCFSRAENLKIHIRSHSGEKPYVCPVEGCNKAYSNSSDRFKHTRTHSMTKPYQCKVPGCNKRYTDPSSLRKHVKTYKHKQQDTSDEDSLMMQERGITSTSDEIEERVPESYCHGKQEHPCSSIDQRMTELDIQERSPCYCRHEKSSSRDNYEEQLKMYRLGAIFNVNSSNCDVLVTSSSRLESSLSSRGSFKEPPMDLDCPLDLSIRPKQ